MQIHNVDISLGYVSACEEAVSEAVAAPGSPSGASRSSRRAGAMCQVKAAMTSGDGRRERRWPTPIPALDVPAPAYLAPGGVN